MDTPGRPPGPPGARTRARRRSVGRQGRCERPRARPGVYQGNHQHRRHGAPQRPVNPLDHRQARSGRGRYRSPVGALGVLVGRSPGGGPAIGDRVVWWAYPKNSITAAASSAGRTASGWTHPAVAVGVVADRPTTGHRAGIGAGFNAQSRPSSPADPWGCPSTSLLPWSPLQRRAVLVRQPAPRTAARVAQPRAIPQLAASRRANQASRSATVRVRSCSGRQRQLLGAVSGERVGGDVEVQLALLGGSDLAVHHSSRRPRAGRSSARTPAVPRSPSRRTSSG